MRLTRQKTLVVTMLLWLSFVSGCRGPRTVFVTDGVPIRIGPDVYGRAYTINPTTREWELGRNKVHFPEGRYVVYYEAEPKK